MRNDHKSLPSLVLTQWSQAPNSTDPAKSAPCTMYIAAGVNYLTDPTLREAALNTMNP